MLSESTFSISLAWAWPLSIAWTTAVAMVAAWWVDHTWGEPPAWAHPVVWMGRYLGQLGPRLWSLPPGPARVGGVLAWTAGGLLALIAGLVADILVQRAWATTLADGEWLGWLIYASGRGVLLGLLLKPLLAWRMLREEVTSAERALEDSLEAGQRQLARLVSRDVKLLDAVQVRESALESLSENLNDSVVAPLFWFVLGGLPGAALYRFANTADAMWGYRDHRQSMGWWAAKVDDVLSWVPARLTACVLWLAAGRVPEWGAMRREAVRTPSPNGGWPMGTLALLLGVRLRKPGVYELNAAGRAAQPNDVVEAVALTSRAVWWAMAVLWVVQLMACWLGGPTT